MEDQMNLFGIALTPGHFVVAGVLLVAYDAIWTWIVSDITATWWFARLQFLLKIGIYTGLVGLVALVAYTPFPVNLIIALAATASIVSIVFWLKRRAH